jgi:hypothetical protein
MPDIGIPEGMPSRVSVSPKTLALGRTSGIGQNGLAAIGITNQRETTVVWERETGQPVHRAIVSTGQVPEQPAVDGSELELSCFCSLLKNGILVEYPAYFGAGKIGVDKQAGSFVNQGFQPIGFQPFANISTLATLPDDGPVYRLAGFPLPDHGGFPLIGNANSGQTILADARSPLLVRQISHGSCSTHPGRG